MLEHEDRVFAALKVFGAGSALDNDISNAVAESRGGASVAFFHALGKGGMGLIADILGFGEGFCDDKFRHVNFVLEEVRDGVFDVSG